MRKIDVGMYVEGEVLKKKKKKSWIHTSVRIQKSEVKEEWKREKEEQKRKSHICVMQVIIIFPALSITCIWGRSQVIEAATRPRLLERQRPATL